MRSDRGKMGNEERSGSADCLLVATRDIQLIGCGAFDARCDSSSFCCYNRTTWCHRCAQGAPLIGWANIAMCRKDFINLSGPIDASCLWATQTPPHTRAVRPLHKRGLDWVEPARCPYRDTLQIHLQGAPSAIHMHGWPLRASILCMQSGRERHNALSSAFPPPNKPK
jgi:hypothetical protein